MPFVSANGGRFHYEIDDFTDPWSEAETILIQHGFGRSSAFWYHWIPYLARDYRVIRRDMRGHGRSEAPDADYDWSVHGLVSDLLGFMDALELEAVHYVGESVGAMQGTVIATDRPERIRTLTLCSMPTAIRPTAADPGLFSVGEKSWSEALRTLGRRLGRGANRSRRVRRRRRVAGAPRVDPAAVGQDSA